MLSLIVAYVFRHVFEGDVGPVLGLGKHWDYVGHCSNEKIPTEHQYPRYSDDGNVKHRFKVNMESLRLISLPYINHSLFTDGWMYSREIIDEL